MARRRPSCSHLPGIPPKAYVSRGIAVVMAIALLAAAPTVWAQWTRVLDVPASNISSVWANGDTIVAGADSTLSVSTDAGATWKPSTTVVAGATSIQAARVRHGRLYAGTYGRGVHVSDDLGDTWLAFNQGLTGGMFNSHLFIVGMLVRGDSLFVATSGAGAYARDLTGGNWQHFGEQFEPNQASNLNAIAAGGTRLLAAGGFNGTVFFRDPGDPDWTLSWLNNVGIVPGLAGLSAMWTGEAWLVGANTGVFRSVLGQEPWTFVDLGLGTLFTATFARRDGDLLAAFGTGGQTFIQRSVDHGANWQILDTLSAVFVNELAISGSDLYAARLDGLWRRAVPVPAQSGSWGSVKSRFR